MKLKKVTKQNPRTIQSFRIKPELKKKLKAAAKKEDVSVSNLIEQILQQYIKQFKI